MIRFKPRRPPHGAACFLYLPSPHAQAGDKLLGGPQRPARAAHLTPREVPSRGGPFFSSVEAKSIRLNQGFASGKTLVRRGAAGRFRARGRCGIPGHRLKLAINCFAVRGVRPGLRISPHGRFPPAGAPFFHSVEAKLIRLNQGFASGKTLVRRGAAGRFRARGRCRTPGHRLRLAINCFAVRGVRPGLRISHLTASARRLSRSKAIPACSAIPSTSSRNSA